MNERGKVLDVQGALDQENRNVIVHNRHGGLNQQWEILYVDVAKPEPTSGLNPDFGLYINRPFMIRSYLGQRRYLDLVGNNVLIKTKNGRPSQNFVFDQKTRTIHPMSNKRKSFDITSSGRNRNLQVANTNSGWF